VICLGTDYYVDTAGSDSNSGKSTSAPWKTVAKVNSYTGFVAGDHILLKRGQVWREQLTVPASGTSSSPIVFGAYGSGSKPMLKGSALVTNWAGAGSTNKWKASLSSVPNQVFFNGVRGTMKTSLSSVAGTLQWYWASGVLYVYATSDPDSLYTAPGIEASIRPSTRSYGIIHLQGRQYVTVEDIDVSQSASFGIYIKPSGQYITIRGCDVGHSLDGGIVAPLSSGVAVTQVTIEDCLVHHNNGGFKEGEPGVATYHEGLTMEGVDGFTIRGCQVFSNYMEGVNFKRGAKNGIIENCLLYSNGLINQYMEGATNIQVRYNKIYDCTYNAGIEMGLETNTYNNDTIKIYDNLFWGNSAAISFWAGSVTSQTRNISIYSNTFYNNEFGVRWKSGATDNYSGTNSIKDNLFWQYQTWYSAIKDETTSRQAIGRTVIAYNAFQQGAASDTTGTSATMTSDPYFVNAGGADFHLKSGSTCIDKGTSVGLTRDFDGKAVPQGSAPDLGAYEYGSTTTTMYTLTTSATNGTVTRTPNQTSYASGASVSLQATPNTGYSFTGWSGDLTGMTNPATLVMGSNKSVTANFAASSSGGGGTTTTGTYYVDVVAGSDSNSGKSTSAPWKTVAKVNSYTGFVAGDHILLKRGQVWREQLTVPASGTSSSPIVFGAYGSGSKPMLKGSALVTNWAGAGSTNKWKASLSSVPNQVFFNGVRGTMKTSLSSVAGTLQWYWASGVLYVYATSDPDSLYTAPGIEASIRPSTRSYGIIHLQGRQYVTVEDIDVSQSASFGIYIKPSGQYITIRGCDVGHSLDGGIVAPLSSGVAVTQVTIEDCLVHHNNGGFKEGEPGVATYHEGLTMEGVDGFTIRGCQVFSNYMEGVNFKRGAKNGIIENCLLYSNGLINQYMEGATNIQVRYNKIYDCTYNAGIEMGLETNTYNNDTIKIYDNLFWGNSAAISFWAGSVTSQTRNISIYSNTFYSNEFGVRWKSGATDNYSGTNSIKDNLFWQYRTWYSAIKDETTSRQAIGRTVIAYNAFQQGAASDTTGTSATMTSDPYFVNAGGADFHLKSSSTCIDKGTSVGLTRDFDGKAVPQGSAPDLGAYEYGTVMATTSTKLSIQASSVESPIVVTGGADLTTAKTPKADHATGNVAMPEKAKAPVDKPVSQKPARDDSGQEPSTDDVLPISDSVRASPNAVMILHVRDEGTGIDPNSVTVEVDGNVVYTGDVDSYDSPQGLCRRTVTTVDYTYQYQPKEAVDGSREVVVAVNARDLAGNVMPEQVYLFAGGTNSSEPNQVTTSGQASLDPNAVSDQASAVPGRLTMVGDSKGNVWTVLSEGDAGSRQVFVSSLSGDGNVAGKPIQVSQGTGDHSKPVIAIDGAGVLYVVWQENTCGNWDVCASVSPDGKRWSAPKPIVDANDNQVNPAIAASRQPNGLVAVVWQDDQAGNQDVYMATSTDAFLNVEITQVTSDSGDQTDPAIAVDGEDAIFLRWTDVRSNPADVSVPDSPPEK
jgi:hypothetical protein